MKTYNEAWEVQQTYEGKPHCWIQWKGTDVCMDFHCECGHHGHFDDNFVYIAVCPICKRKYFVNGHVELIEIEDSNGMSERVADI